MPVGAGAVGEVCVKGPAVMLGYEGDPEGEPRGGWMHTGDLGYLDVDGYLHLAGRRREMIIRGGENIFPGEIEAILMTHPAVQECSVVGIPDSVMTEVPVAFLVRRPEGAGSETIAGFARAHLSRHKCPVEFIWVDELPRNALGKIQKAELRDAAKTRAR